MPPFFESLGPEAGNETWYGTRARNQKPADGISRGKIW